MAVVASDGSSVNHVNYRALKEMTHTKLSMLNSYTLKEAAKIQSSDCYLQHVDDQDQLCCQQESLEILHDL
jgi:hypothetical protein